MILPAPTNLTGDADDLITALGNLKTDGKPSDLSTVSVTNIADAADVATLVGYDYTGDSLVGSSVTAITGGVDDVLSAINTRLTSLNDTAFNVTVEGEVTTTQLSTIHSAMGSGTLTGTGITQVTGTAATIISTLDDVNNKPTRFNAVLSDGEVATIAQLSSIDTLTGEGTITANVSTSAADLATYLGENEASDIDDLLSQATNVAITAYSGQDLSALSNVSGSTTFELVVAGDLTITLDQSEDLNVIDKITISGDERTLTLSGESFKPDNADSHFADLATITTSGSDNVVAIADYGEDDDGSTIDLKQLTNVDGISSFTVTGDTGINIIQLSVALTTWHYQR